MAALGLAGGRAVVAGAVLVLCRHPGLVHRAGVQRLKPRSAEGGRGEQQREGEQPGAAEEPDHRGLKYVAGAWGERGMGTEDRSAV